MCKRSCVLTVFSWRRLGVGGRRCCSAIRAAKRILFATVVVLFHGPSLENSAVKFPELLQKLPLETLWNEALEGLASLGGAQPRSKNCGYFSDAHVNGGEFLSKRTAHSRRFF